MKIRPRLSESVPASQHRRSVARQAETAAFRRELARLDDLSDHVLDVVVDRLLDDLDLARKPCAGRAVCRGEADRPLVFVNPECVERTIGSATVPVA